MHNLQHESVRKENDCDVSPIVAEIAARWDCAVRCSSNRWICSTGQTLRVDNIGGCSRCTQAAAVAIFTGDVAEDQPGVASDTAIGMPGAKHQSTWQRTGFALPGLLRRTSVICLQCGRRCVIPRTDLGTYRNIGPESNGARRFRRFLGTFFSFFPLSESLNA